MRRKSGAFAHAAAELVMTGETIALTAGTTTTEVVRNLRTQRGITVVTNTVNVAMELSNRKDIVVFVTGGHLRGDWFSLVGPGGDPDATDMCGQPILVLVDSPEKPLFMVADLLSGDGWRAAGCGG